MKLLKDLDVSGKRVFLRADLDVPISSPDNQIPVTDIEAATRLTNLKPTVDYLIGNGALQIVIAGHMGRPKGLEPDKSTKLLLGHLEKILGQKITFNNQLPEESGNGMGPVSSSSQAGSARIQNPSSINTQPRLILFENLRYWPGEEANDLAFAAKLAQMADVYVNDAFGNCHRAHASMVALPSLLPHAAGLHLEKEVEELTKLTHDPQRPFAAVVGGAKIETKIPLITNLAKIADNVLVGGDLPLEITKQNLKFAENVLVGKLTVDGKEIDNGTIGQFSYILKNAKTIVWNGPMGLIEEGFVDGTLAVERAIAESGAYSVIGGGDSTQFLGRKGLLSKFSFVSAGGGAMLEFLAGHELPAIRALE